MTVAYEVRAEVTRPDGEPVVFEHVVSMTVNDGAVLTITHRQPDRPGSSTERLTLFAPGAWSTCSTDPAR